MTLFLLSRYFSTGENAPVSRRFYSTFHPRRNHLKNPRGAQSQYIPPLAGVLEPLMASSRDKPCRTGVEGGDSDREGAVEDAVGAGEEADFRSLILQRSINAEGQNCFNQVVNFVQLSYNYSYKLGLGYLWRRLQFDLARLVFEKLLLTLSSCDIKQTLVFFQKLFNSVFF